MPFLAFAVRLIALWPDGLRREVKRGGNDIFGNFVGTDDRLRETLARHAVANPPRQNREIKPPVFKQCLDLTGFEIGFHHFAVTFFAYVP